MAFTDERLGQAYLFSGPRGCGKTTAARILAKAVNCEAPAGGEPCCVCKSCRAVSSGEHLDVMEIDGASNRGIDQIRELKSHVGLAPFMGGSKVYILDEVHMLTMEAFNALLKTLEEPPPFALFIFATTEPNKVPVTIRSRCQHIPFHRISAEGIAMHLRSVAIKEGFDAEDSALWEIARNADGALRDALSLAEQALALGNGKLSAEAVNGLFGGSGRTELERFASLLRKNPKDASAMLKELLGRGVSPDRFIDALFPLFRDMWVYSLWGEASFSGLTLSEEEKKFLASEVPGWSSGELGRMVSVCASLYPRTRQGLRSDVFHGLLIFELLGAISGESERADAFRSGGERPVPSATPTKTKSISQNSFPDKKIEPPAARVKPRENSANELDSADLSNLNKNFVSLWQSDLSLCAALIDARLSVLDGALVIDCSESSPVSKAVLESTRARVAIEKAFGLARGESVDSLGSSVSLGSPVASETSGASARQGERPVVRGATPPGKMSMEELSSFLGADLLMAKPARREDIGAPDEDLNGADM
jgi:DNA polymerase-3 subunit gamma/tau